MNILAFGASNSGHSINQQLAVRAALALSRAQLISMKPEDFDIPLYREDLEAELTTPPPVLEFLAKVEKADGIIISHAEHNGSFNAAYKNLIDWASRKSRSVFAQRPTLILATSMGARGGTSVMQHAHRVLPHLGARIVDAMAVPHFDRHFDHQGVILKEPALQAQLESALAQLELAIKANQLALRATA